MNDEQQLMGDGPFGVAAHVLRRKGWVGTLPLPYRAKKTPPEGWTGHSAPYPSGADIQSWLDDGHGGGNIAIRMPDDVLGLDVDDYIKGEVTKTGLAAVHELEQTWGTLPPTWRSTSRKDGRSGIRFFRVPSGLRWPSKAAPSIETVHKGHRYAVVAPSIHPDTNQAYQWVGPDGTVGVEPPAIDDLPELPHAWVTGLTGGQLAGEHVSTGAQVNEYIESLRDSMGEPCRYVTDQLQGLRDAVTGKTGESRHDAVNERVMAIVRGGQMGHAGVERVLRQAHRLWMDTMTSERGADEAQREWDRSVDGAIDKVGVRDLGTRCLCRTEAEREAQDAYFADAAARSTQAAIETATAAQEAGETVQSTGDYYLDQALLRERTRRGAKRIVDAEETEAELARHNFDDDYLTREQLASLPKPVPLIDGILARTSTILLRGRDATFKSFIAIDWALCIATGQDWLGREVEQGRVLYVMGEGAPGLEDRVTAWETARGVRVPGDAFVVRTSPVNLYRGGAAYVEFLRRVQDGGFSLVVFDTLRKVSGGADGNGSDMGVVQDRIEEIRRATIDGGSGAVLTISHTAKDDVDTRGYSGIEDDTDIIWHSKRKDEGSLQLVLQNPKNKNAAETGEIQVSMQPSVNSLVVAPLGFGGRVVRLDQGDVARQLWAALCDHNEIGITQSALRDAPYGFKKATVSQTLNRWVQAGHVDRKGNFFHADPLNPPEFFDALRQSWGTADAAPEGWD